MYDMDDELRDALIALDDEAYIEDLGDEFFDDLDDEEYQPLAGESDEELGPDATWEDHFKQFQKNKNKFDSDDDFEEEEEDEFDENGLGRFKSSRGFDSKSMASRYSMTSSAMFRNSGLTSLDEQFDRIEAEYMDDDEEYDEECPEGVPMREDFDDIMNEFLHKYEIVGKKVVTQSEGETGGDKLGILRHTLLDTGSDEAISKAKILESLEEKPKKASKESELQRPEQKVRDVWDAQSIISTYSNIYNHPSLIKEPSKPKIVISSKGFPRLQSEQDEKLQNALNSIDESGLDDDIDIDAHLAQLTGNFDQSLV
jgi:protein LTV1